MTGTRNAVPESRFPCFGRKPNPVDTFDSFDFFDFDIFDRFHLLLKIQRLTILSVWRRSCPYRLCTKVSQGRGDAMSPVVKFLRKWTKWYGVLRYRKGFGLLDSVRLGLWLAHS